MSEENAKSTTWVTWISAIAALLAAIGASQFIPKILDRIIEPEVTNLRFDGVYQEGSIAEGSDSRKYLRFYQDGVVVGTPVQQPANPAKISEWVDRGRLGVKQLPEGKYITKEGGGLEFYNHSKLVGVQVDYYGKIKDGGLTLELHSKSSNGHEDDAEYVFLNVPGMGQ